MPRTARIVIPGVAHHVIQRGNRQQRLFMTHGDCRRYVDMLADACAQHAVRCLAWCLMPNHVHLALVPPAADDLRSVMSSVHTRYAQGINGREGLTGHLFQDRFRSYAMDDAHMLIALRYIENNPVKAGLAQAPEEWRWSSARAHLGIGADPLTDVAALAPHVPNWRAYLRAGVEAADAEEKIEGALRTGRPIGLGTVPHIEGQSLTPAARDLNRPRSGPRAAGP
jgi:putative transposase